MGSMNGADTRQRILVAALEVFAEFGFQGGTVREIVERAGVNLAAVNYHFHGKERLYQEVFGFAFMETTGQTLRLSVAPPSAIPEDNVRQLIAGFLSGMGQPDTRAQHSRLLAWELLRPSGVMEQVKRKHVLPHFEIVCDIIRDFLPDQTNSLSISVAALWLVGQCLVFQRGVDLIQELYPDLGDISGEELARFVAALALNGLKNGSQEL